MIVAIVAIAAAFKIECIKPDNRDLVFTFVVADCIFPNTELIRLPFKMACYLFVLYEN